MKTLNVTISDLEYTKFGLKSDSFSFSDFLDLVSKELIKQRLEESVKMAEQYGLSTMTMEEITEEVNAARNDVKDNN